MSLKLGGKQYSKGGKYSKSRFDTEGSRGGRRGTTGDDLSDDSLNRGKPKASLALNKNLRDKGKGNLKVPALGMNKKPSQRSRRTGNKIHDSFSSKSEGKKSMGSSRKRSHRKNSPEFGLPDSDSGERLETFGNRMEKPKTNYKRGLDIDIDIDKDDEKSRGALTSQNWNNKRKNRRDKDAIKPPRRPVSKHSSKPRLLSTDKSRDQSRDLSRNQSRDKSRDKSRNRDSRTGLKDARSQRSRFASSKGGGDNKSRATSSYDDPRFEKHLSAKMAKNSRKTLNFNEKKEKREKDWLLQFHSHKPIVHFSDKFEQPPKKTQSYLVTLGGVKKIPLADLPIIKQKGVTTTAYYCCTLFDERDKEFIGRSYTSRPIKLAPDFVSTEEIRKDYLFLHLLEEDTGLSMIIETYLEIVELDKGGKTTYVSLGYGKFDLFGDKGIAVATSLPMFKGSPRALLLKVPFNNLITNVCSLVVQIKEYNALNKLKLLIPSTTICGMKDIIPGLVGSKLSLKRDKINLCRTEDLVLSNMQIETGKGFEKIFMTSLERLSFEKLRADDEIEPKATLLRLGSPRIVERKMYIDFNNSWKAANENIFISLESPNDAFNTYQVVGHVEIKDFILDPNTAVIFKIEFVIDMPTSVRKKKEKATYTIAWGCFLPDYNLEGAIQSGTLN